ncbi:phosphatidylethanolamine-binding protein [Sphaerosporella brunnea]|uniref:Phosphatidylethanolamine-binding protein n=1 Tax=Sphaerosporella brunnea TaxID=1250544 RepID=A0A5J5ERQ7_9PEZI|nr:phosphatidylethanolamine-binding protein [Sphaerosporella brunnea]
MNLARSLLRPTTIPIPAGRSIIAAVRGLRTQDVPPAQTDSDPTPSEAKFRTIERMPFQTYQYALEIIRKDRLKKFKEIELERQRIAGHLASGFKPDDREIKSMKKHLEYLRVQADINNPRVKYNFDRGLVSLHKPVYRYLMNRKWREYRRPILMQRLEQMNVIPDVLPKLDPVVDVQLRFQGRDIQPGDLVGSLQSEHPPTFKVVKFTEGPMLCTAAVVDSDVPRLCDDRFGFRLHWMVANIPLSHLQQQAIGTGAKPSDVVWEWIPPHVQKGSPYHRYTLILFKQPARFDVEDLKNKLAPNKMDSYNFMARSFMQKHALEPIGAFMFRGEWDEHTKKVMQRNKLKGWDQQLVRVKEE